MPHFRLFMPKAVSGGKNVILLTSEVSVVAELART
jgi:hypothetical protein